MKPTPVGDRVHAPSAYPNRAYCGSPNTKSAMARQDVTCPNCLAALRADEETR
ncbi:hypothetical protein K8F61_05265 [Microbacterium resistens]|uniref:Uncharacterized protein n=1 Tax=Microbacterium resistens TaxID=156977 RepID=A0ABY3RUH5_9MICO|nr:hypothetical protein [Microbacterium resistens]UGS27599.1 hypothetical protein K8F61_05265 [Microbacterium resistens]